MSKRVRCKACGKYGLTWVNTRNGWRLAWPKSGRLHLCKAGRAYAEARQEISIPEPTPVTAAEMIERGWLEPLAQRDPVGITPTPEEQPNGNPGHISHSETNAYFDTGVLQSVVGELGMDAGRTDVGLPEASPVRKERGEVNKLGVRLRCKVSKVASTLGGGVAYSWLCHASEDPNHCKPPYGVGSTAESAYRDYMRSCDRIAQAKAASEAAERRKYNRRLAWVCGAVALVIALVVFRHFVG